MKKTLLTILLIIILLALVMFIPMPHGGNFAEGFSYEVRQYFSAESQKAREQEKKDELLQKEEARKSWREFERDNLQYFPKSK